MKNTKKLIFVTTLLLLGISCREDDFDVLPRETQEGLNTFGCLIGSELLVPINGTSGIGGRGADGLLTYYKEDSFVNSGRPPYFAIQASGSAYLYIYIPSLSETGTYTLQSSNGYKGIYSPPWPHTFANIYGRNGNPTRYLSFDNSGELKITRFDTVSTVISGTFMLRLVDAETKTDTIEVTQGVFDINWTTLNCGRDIWHQPCLS